MDTKQLLQGVDFEVGMKPALLEVGGEFKEVPDRFVTYRMDNGDPLGVVGSRYKVHQHKEAIIRTVDEVEKVTSNYTVKHTIEGANIYTDFQFPDISLLNGVKDEDTLFGMKLWANHDGLHVLLFQFYGMRLVCTNGMRHFMGMDQLRKTHVKSVSLESLHVQLPDIIKAHQDGYANMYKSLVNKPVIDVENLEGKVPPRLIKKSLEAYPEEYAISRKNDAWTQYQSFTRVISHADNQEVWKNNTSKMMSNLFLSHFNLV